MVLWFYLQQFTGKRYLRYETTVALKSDTKKSKMVLNETGWLFQSAGRPMNKLTSHFHHILIKVRLVLCLRLVSLCGFLLVGEDARGSCSERLNGKNKSQIN